MKASYCSRSSLYACDLNESKADEQEKRHYPIVS